MCKTWLNIVEICAEIQGKSRQKLWKVHGCIMHNYQSEKLNYGLIFSVSQRAHNAGSKIDIYAQLWRNDAFSSSETKIGFFSNSSLIIAIFTAIGFSPLNVWLFINWALDCLNLHTSQTLVESLTFSFHYLVLLSKSYTQFLAYF